MMSLKNNFINGPCFRIEWANILNFYSSRRVLRLVSGILETHVDFLGKPVALELLV